MSNEILISAVKAYGLDTVRIMQMQCGYRNKNYPIELRDGSFVNIIFYKQEPAMLQTIRGIHRLGAHLSAHGYPARTTYDSRILRVSRAPHEQFAALYVYLPGQTIPWDAYTMEHLKSLGKSMSDMHALLQHLPMSSLIPSHVIQESMLARMRQYFADRNVNHAMQAKLGVNFVNDVFNDLAMLIESSAYLPHQQPLHLDFVRSNVLFACNSSAITGVLDFEKAAYGNPVIDIARTLAFLFVDCKYKTEAQIQKYFLQSGYMKRGKSDYVPIAVKRRGIKNDILESMVTFFLVYDFYKFLLHNPYESLCENQHFIRTLQLLIARGKVYRVPSGVTYL